jgi:hypothetical protein
MRMPMCDWVGACGRVQDLVKKLSKDHVIRDAIPMFVLLAGDDHVRQRTERKRECVCMCVCMCV